jgi:hypothetical protein
MQATEQPRLHPVLGGAVPRWVDTEAVDHYGVVALLEPILSRHPRLE